ncbi:hypothetical protein QC761_0113830 [Podospora bellae-mahoneyi]|uniref:Uncharacterized protein n=1 Tax=Podospora bellae-mahoneyi TaxID=2093777 RepID=A0ABR0FAL0_9PEZI|nr:hypothetical protein QC761_0113830 [Podospora bellae-mahoneyi]
MEEHSQSKQLVQHPASQQEEEVDRQPPNSRGAPAVRLEMDLDVNIELKGKIKGNVTVAILEDEKRQD